MASWYACYTRARHEKKVDALLRGLGIDAYLPLVPRERRWHDRTRLVEWPLFPSYVFARFDPASAARVAGTPGVAAIVGFDGEPARIPADQVENVRRFATRLAEAGLAPEEATAEEHRRWLRVGERVRIASGPFRGVEATVVERRGAGRVLVVGVEAIGRGLKVEVDVTALETLRAA